MDRKYDYLIVGSGLFGAIFAYCAKNAGKKCLVIDKCLHLVGSVYCGINVHNLSEGITNMTWLQLWRKYWEWR